MTLAQAQSGELSLFVHSITPVHPLEPAHESLGLGRTEEVEGDDNSKSGCGGSSAPIKPFQGVHSVKCLQNSSVASSQQLQV